MIQPKPDMKDEAPYDGMLCHTCNKGTLKLCQKDWISPAIKIKDILVWHCPVCDEMMFPKETSDFIDRQYDLMDRSDMPNEIEN